MSDAFEDAFNTVLAAEGGFSVDPRDPGNWTGGRRGAGDLKGTQFGISAAAFPLLDIKALTLDQAEALYRAHYWAPICGDQLPPSVAIVVFDTAVNQGVHTAAVILQQALGMPPDGWIGVRTIAAAKNRPARDVVMEICARRALAYAGYADITTDGLGWMRRLFRLANQF